MKQILPIKPLTLLLMGAATGFAAKAQVNFDPQVTYATGINPYGVAIGDFNGDGIQDLAVTNTASNNVGILLGNRDGSFQSQVTYATGAGPDGIATGDFNGDGIQDLAVANSGSSNVGILLGNRDGSFQPQVAYATGGYPLSVAVGDFNGDGKIDIAVANNNSNNVSILLGNGDGSFQSQVTYATGTNSDGVAVGDFNGDGKPDIAVLNNIPSSVSGFPPTPVFVPGTVSVLLNNGDGSFQSQITYATGNSPHGVAAGDFNGDGIQDLVVANTFSSNISILLGNGDGSFQSQVTYATGTGPDGVAIGDFNGDGKTDVAVGTYSGISVLQGNGNGSFQSEVAFSTDGATTSIATADFNGDSKPDIVTTNNNTNNISILLNTTPFATPVTLTSFTGALQHGLAMLSWQSGVESNFKQYEVEAGVDNKDFSTVGIVAAKGSNHSYTFSTAQAAATADYRLKLVDKDGKYTYSNVITLSQSGNEKVTVYPNPVYNTLNISSSVTGIMHIYTAAGQLVKTIQLQAGKNVADITTLSMGVYYGIVNGMKVQFVKK